MEVSFDGTNRLVLPADPTGVFNIKYVYSEWKRWILQDDNMKYPQTFTTVGGDPITSDEDIPTYFYLMNGWRVKWPDDNISVEVQGNLLVYGGLDTPYLPVSSDYSYNVTSVVGANAKMTQAEFDQLMTGYNNKDLYKADLTSIEAGVNIKAVNGVDVTSVDDFKASDSDLTVIKTGVADIQTAIGELHNFDPDNDVVAKVTKVETTVVNTDLAAVNDKLAELKSITTDSKEHTDTLINYDDTTIKDLIGNVSDKVDDVQSALDTIKALIDNLPTATLTDDEHNTLMDTKQAITDDYNALVDKINALPGAVYDATLGKVL